MDLGSNQNIYQRRLWGGRDLVQEQDEEPADVEIIPSTEQAEDFKFSQLVLTPNRIGRLRLLGQLNEYQFRRLWILFQYQQFKINESFQNAKNYAEEWVKNENLGDRQYLSYPAKRNQILKQMTLLKQRSFIEFFTRETRFTSLDGRDFPFDIFQEAMTCNIEELLCNDEFMALFATNLMGAKLKLEKNVWDTILNGGMFDLQDIEIELPESINILFNRYWGNKNTLERQPRPSSEDLLLYKEDLEKNYDLNYLRHIEF